MSSANQPVLPQGAGYGVGMSPSFFHVRVLINGIDDDQSLVRLFDKCPSLDCKSMHDQALAYSLVPLWCA